MGVCVLAVRYDTTTMYHIHVQTTNRSKVTVPVIDKDEYLLCHAICKDTVSIVKRETSHRGYDLRQEVVVRGEHVVHFQDNPSFGSRTRETTA